MSGRPDTLALGFREINCEKTLELEESVKCCAKCHQTKPLEAFPANRRTLDARSSWCRRCHADATARWRAANPKYIQAYNERRRVDPLPPWARALADQGRASFQARRADG